MFFLVVLHPELDMYPWANCAPGQQSVQILPLARTSWELQRHNDFARFSPADFGRQGGCSPVPWHCHGITICITPTLTKLEQCITNHYSTLSCRLANVQTHRATPAQQTNVTRGMPWQMPPTHYENDCFGPKSPMPDLQCRILPVNGFCLVVSAGFKRNKSCRPCADCTYRRLARKHKHLDSFEGFIMVYPCWLIWSNVLQKLLEKM